ncbi:MAG: Ig-like domain-containing protein [Myxococcota bacterium]
MKHRSTAALLVFAFMGCGDDSATLDVGPGDSGVDVRDTAPVEDVGVDAEPVIVGAPFVLQVLPAPGDEMVEATTSILILFNETMATDVGTVRLQPGDIRLAASSGLWLSGEEIGVDLPENVAVFFEVPTPLRGGVEYTAFVERDFQDVGGAPLDEVFDWSFQVVDNEPPEVVASSPAEGASVSAVGTTEIRLEFNEQMQAVGEAELRGGPGTLGEARWEPTAVVFPVTGLIYDASYSIELRGFVDEADLPLEAEPYLVDGELDFTTGPDTDAPVIVASTPVEGMRGVNPALRVVRLDFNEAMNRETDTTAVFSDGTASTTVTGEWIDERSLRYDVAGLVATMGPHALDLTTAVLEDPRGNPLDRSAYLGDGSLDFVVGEDSFGPRVVDSNPAEGSADIDFTLTRVIVRFDEPMNTEAGTATLSDGVDVVELGPIWSVGDTIVEFSVAGRLRAGTAYRVDLTSFEDLEGNPLDGTPYLGDGVVDFQTEDASGDSCLEPLTPLQAITLPDGSLQWNLPSVDFVDNGGTDVCDADSSGASDDVVIRYVKTSGTLAEGGAALAIDVQATGSGTTDINWALQSSCEAVEDPDSDALLGCHHEVQQSGRVFDLPPGEYFLWVAKDTTGTFPGADVTIREVGELPEGESCARPFTTASVVYSAPARADLPHLYEIPPSEVSDFDRIRSSGDEGGITCGPNHGIDGVLRFDKSAGTALQIRATPADIRSGASDLTLEVTRGCSAIEPDFSSLGCEDGFDRTQTFDVSAPAGPIYIWFAAETGDRPFPGATVSILEIPVGEGESCGTARPLDATGSVTLDSSRALGAGSCFDSGNLTWYSATPAEAISIVQSDLEGTVVVRDPDTGRELACSDDISEGLAVIVPGSSLCIGVKNDAALSTLTTTAQAYDGLRGRITDPGYLRGFTSSGAEDAWTSDAWMETTASTIYLGEGPFGAAVHQIPKRDGSRALVYSTSAGITSTRAGYAGVTVGEELFTLDDTSSAGSSRLYRAWDALRFPWMPEAWDTGERPYDGDARTMVLEPGGAEFLIATHDSTEVHFYHAPVDAPGDVVEIGSNDQINDVRGLASDDTYVYLCGDIESGGPEGVVRIPRTELGNATYMPEILAVLDVSSTRCPVVTDDPRSPRQLYFRSALFGSAGNNVHVVVDPGGATPLHLGSILRLGGSSDYAMAYDLDERALYLFETQTVSIGRIVRVE